MSNPSESSAPATTGTTSTPSGSRVPDAAAMRALRDSLHLDLSQGGSNNDLKSHLLATPDIVQLLAVSISQHQQAQQHQPQLQQHQKQQQQQQTSADGPPAGSSTAATSATSSCAGFLQPKYVTSEQRQYAQGFIDALSHIYKMRGAIPHLATPSHLLSPVGPPVTTTAVTVLQQNTVSTSSGNKVEPAGSKPTLFSHIDAQRNEIILSLPKGLILPSPTKATAGSSFRAYTAVAPKPEHSAQQSLSVLPPTNGVAADHPQLNHLRATSTPLSNGSTTNTNNSRASPSSPSPPHGILDPVLQERIKLERKRARNRLAASRCRKRKLDRIETLDEEVRDLQDANTRLKEQIEEAKRMCVELREAVHTHEAKGCRVECTADGTALTVAQK